MNPETLSKLSNAKSGSISPENVTGEKGKGGMADPLKQRGQRNVAYASGPARGLGVGWKVNPFVGIGAGETPVIADIKEPVVIRHILMTRTGNRSQTIIRFEGDLQVMIQDLDWRSEGRYLPRQSDMISVAYWYQTEPHKPIQKLPGKNMPEVN